MIKQLYLWGKKSQKRSCYYSLKSINSGVKIKEKSLIPISQKINYPFTCSLLHLLHNILHGMIFIFSFMIYFVIKKNTR